MELMLTSALGSVRSKDSMTGYLVPLLKVVVVVSILMPALPHFSFIGPQIAEEPITQLVMDSSYPVLTDKFFTPPFEHFYDFTTVPRAFHHRTPLHYLSQFPKQTLVSNILAVLPATVRDRAKSFLPYFFYFAERYQVDPYWAISIAWTESHFNFRAQSYVGARGIMQIMPATEGYLLQLLRYSPSHRGNKTLTNIHLGVYYLARLLRQFHGNYVEATVAYNMGPGWVKSWKHKHRRVGSSRNVYLNKVKRYYRQLSLAHYNLVRQCEQDYLQTYVVKRSGHKRVNMGMDNLLLKLAPLIVDN